MKKNNKKPFAVYGIVLLFLLMQVLASFASASTRENESNIKATWSLYYFGNSDIYSSSHIFQMASIYIPYQQRYDDYYRNYWRSSRQMSWGPRMYNERERNIWRNMRQLPPYAWGDDPVSREERAYWMDNTIGGSWYDGY